MVAIESMQLRDNLFIRVDKYPYSGINPETKKFEDMGIFYLFTLYTKIDTPNSNLQLASCMLRDDSVLEHFGVHCDYYGKGYGTILLDYIKAFASTKGYTSLKMFITPLANLMIFFKKRGFTLKDNVAKNNKSLIEIEITLEPQPTLKEIMSYRNGHDSSLVDKINWIGNDPVRKPMLTSILKFLANQSADECRIDAGLEGEITDDVVEMYGYDILTQFCDDKDLETIISYCRIDCPLAKDKERYKSIDEVISHFNQKFPHEDW